MGIQLCRFLRGDILGSNSGLDPFGRQVGDSSPAHAPANNRLAIGQGTDKAVMTVLLAIRMLMTLFMFVLSVLMMAKAVESIVELFGVPVFNVENKKAGTSPEMPGD